MALPDPLPVELSILRIIAQGLVPETACATVTDVAERMGALQGQLPSAIPHALMLRTRNATADDVTAAFDERLLVRSWPMRGTLHVTTACDHHWIRRVLLHRYASYFRSWDRDGFDEAERGRVRSALRERVSGGEALTRAQVLETLTDARIEPVGAPEKWARRVLMSMHLEGVLVQGSARGCEHLITDATTLDNPEGLYDGRPCAHGEEGHEVALSELARRYISSHGPVTTEDFARWTGVTLGESTRAFIHAVRGTSTRDHRVVAARWDEEHRWLEPISEQGSAGEGISSAQMREARTLLYVPNFLIHRTPVDEKDARGLFFLPSFDELHVGYRNRSCLTDREGELAICPSNNGMFRPLIVEGGRLRAVVFRGETLWVSPPSARLEQRALRERTRWDERL